jgi:hypothetical protein
MKAQSATENTENYLASAVQNTQNYPLPPPETPETPFYGPQKTAKLLQNCTNTLFYSFQKFQKPPKWVYKFYKLPFLWGEKVKNYPLKSPESPESPFIDSFARPL